MERPSELRRRRTGGLPLGGPVPHLCQFSRSSQQSGPPGEQDRTGPASPWERHRAEPYSPRPPRPRAGRDRPDDRRGGHYRVEARDESGGLVAGPLVVDVAVRPGDEALNITPEGLRWRALNEAVRTPGLRIDGCHARVRPWAGRPCPLACYCRPHVLSDGAVFCILPERLNRQPRTTLATSPQGLRPAARPHAAGPSGVAHVADEDGGGGRSGTGAQDTCARRASAQQRWRS